MPLSLAHLALSFAALGEAGLRLRDAVAHLPPPIAAVAAPPPPCVAACPPPGDRAHS